MNPTLLRFLAKLTGAPLIAASAAISVSGLFAQTDALKASNNDTLDLATSWSDGVVPGTGNIAVWNGAATSTGIGTGISVAGVRFDSLLSGNVTITGAYNGTTVSCAAGTITLANHGLAAGQPIYIASNAPTGLTNSVGYFVVNPTTNTFQVSATPGGSVISFAGSSSTTTIRGGGGSLSLGANGINLSAAPAGRSATFAGYTNLTANQTWTLGGTDNITQLNHTGIITGTGGLSVGGSGLGVLSLQAPNTFSGGLTLNPGGAIKIGGAINAASSAVVSTAVGTGPLVINGGKIFGGTDTGSSNITINGNFTVNVGTSANNGRLGLVGAIQLGGAERTVTLGRTIASPSLLITGNATTSGAQASIRINVVANGPATSVSNGTLRLNAEQSAIDGNLWVGVGLQGATTYANNAGLILGNRTITVTGTSSHFASGAGSPTLTVETGAVFNTSDGTVNSRSSQIAGLNGGGTVTNLDTDGTASGGNNSAVTVGNNNTSGTFTGRILNGVTANTELSLGLSPHVDSIVSLTKTGTGTQILSGANKYTGNTTINGGKLVTTTASSHGAGAYTVANTATLGVRVHQAGSSLGLTGLTLGNSTLELDLSTFGNPAAPLINNAGTLTVNGPVTVNVVGSSGTLTAGTYTLVSSTGRSGTGSFTLGTLPVGVSATLAESGNNLNLTITNVNLSYEWTGATNNLWNTGGANINWTLGGAATAYSDATARDVLLNDSAPGSTAIDLTSVVTPKYVAVATSTLAYTITGTGGIGGTAALNKSGASTLTLGTANTYSGGTTVTDGTLNVTGSLADSGAVTVNGGTAAYTVGSDDTVGALTLTSGTINGSGTLSPASVSVTAGTISAKLGGSATVTKTGTGNATLSGANTYTGVTTVSQGTLTLGNAQALGSTAGGTVLAANTSSTGTSVILPDGLTVTGETITIGGLGNGSRGVIRVASGSATWAGDVVIDNSSGLEARLGGSTTSTSGSSVTLTISGAISGGNSSLPAGTVAAAIRSNSATDTIVLSGANTYAGDTGLWAGILRLSGGDNRLPVTTRLVTNSFTGQPIKLDLNGTNQQLAGLLDSDAGASTGLLTTVTNESTTASVLTIANADANDFTGPVTGNLSLVKSGAGTLTLSGTRSYTGGTTVSGGTLALVQPGLADTADVRLAGGILALNYGGTDTVRSLYIGGVQQPAGVYGASGSGASTLNDAVFTGTGTLTVTQGPVTDPFASWAAGFGLTGNDAAADADPDADGSANLMEWILGGNPTLADAAAKAPQLVKDATHLNLVFDREDATESAVTLVARWGVDLATWNSVAVGTISSGPDANGVTVAVVENGASPDTVTVSVPLANAVSGRLFINLRATKN